MTAHISYLASLVSLFFLTIMIFWLYRDYRVDQFRQKLFTLRDQLFDEATADKLSFNDNAYGMLRNTMNGAIRFGHRLNLSQMLIFTLLADRGSQKIGATYSDRLEQSLANRSDEQKKLVQQYHQRMHFIIIEHIVFSSPLLLISMILPLAFLLEAKKRVSSVITLFKSPLDTFDDVALLS